MLELGKPVPNVTPTLPLLLVDDSLLHPSMLQRCGQDGALRFAAGKLCAKGLLSFQPVRSPERPMLTDMVRFKEADPLISGRWGFTPLGNKSGMPVENVFEKLSDEVTLPNSRPRNSP
jgi:hypothetical protein